MIKITYKNTSLSLFHINACSRCKNSDDLKQFLSLSNNSFDIIVITETRILKQVYFVNNLNLHNYSYEFTPTETAAGCSLL